MIIQSKDTIADALQEKVNAFLDYVAGLDRIHFEAKPEGKWSAGQTLEHLVRSIRPLNIAYGLRGFVLRFFFGKANRPSRSYEALVERYKQRLASGGRASGPFIPPVVSFYKRSRLITRYRRKKDRLIRQMYRYSEEELDSFILPHPLLGKLTLREMLFFTIHHNEHHLNGLMYRKMVTEQSK